MLVFWFKNLLGALLLPPANGLLLLALAALFRRRRWAGGLGWAGGLLLLLQSLPLVSGALLAPLEDRAGLPPQGPNGAQAIVVLGGGMVETLPSLGGDQPKDGTLVRLRYAARYARSWHLPVLVSGGRPPNRVYSEAEVMARILEQEFAVPVRWREDGSRDTAAGNSPHCAGDAALPSPACGKTFPGGRLRGGQCTGPVHDAKRPGRVGVERLHSPGLGAGAFLPRPPRMAGHRLGQPDGALRCGGTNGRGVITSFPCQ